MVWRMVLWCTAIYHSWEHFQNGMCKFCGLPAATCVKCWKQVLQNTFYSNSYACWLSRSFHSPSKFFNRLQLCNCFVTTFKKLCTTPCRRILKSLRLLLLFINLCNFQCSANDQKFIREKSWSLPFLCFFRRRGKKTNSTLCMSVLNEKVLCRNQSAFSHFCEKKTTVNSIPNTYSVKIKTL